MAILEENQQNTPKGTNNIDEKDYREQTNDNHPDPSAKRNIGLNGKTERSDQKDKLENLHIGGGEVSGYGANDPDSRESIAQGPGFEFEGSYEEMNGTNNGLRMQDQPLGSDDTEGDEADYSRI
ncbi:MAG: hypothetical protein COW65_02015 [Cytophagales bacterium CG18_big_fil_WC_8_21_14_2_50_42_9]|nr:MAG: hypothetical protein COW65_02015 [Cytophagales bacterium CG18_big_fil_WC_8_21_14_2_50_42_9]